MSKKRASVNRQVLEGAGWELVETKSGKRFWRHRDTGEKRVEDAALELLRQRRSRWLRKAGWKAVSVEGHIYWRNPDTHRLYPERAALYVEDLRREKKDMSGYAEWWGGRGPRDRKVRGCFA